MLGTIKLLIRIIVSLLVVFLSIGINHAEEQCYVMTVTANIEYKDTWLLQWDPDNPEEILPNGSVSVNVIGGWKNFSWSVSGNDFWFDSEHTLTSIETVSRTVTVYAGSNACGAATISVTDSRNVSATGSLRCTNGKWSDYHWNECILPGEMYTSIVEGSTWVTFGRTKGKYRQDQATHIRYIHNQDCNYCGYFCGSGDGCSPAIGCQVCLSGSYWTNWPCAESGAGYVKCLCTSALNWREWICP
jgi:hypothetical protein